jgi:hypothetical protein
MHGRTSGDAEIFEEETSKVRADMDYRGMDCIVT